ncbi:hypothetical protein HELRODRAFT_82145 [Helobdella robusta]|uniref:Transcription elongation factor n=1 Tax=Helobdella robusta TaxID=6412 RepID=T1G4N6_HELRO|nr:hypothetical protein HELRODRAFT_82145 [Helobdella robusta]ESO01254.1 hypothetical protein HELRODRAFT_82145 [Helobdella robusta]
MGCYEEVVTIGKKLEKMITGKTVDESQGLDLLKSLKALPITLDILTRSRIGMTVNNFRKTSKNEEVGTLAKSLIKYWKKKLASTSNNSNNNSEVGSNPKSDSSNTPASTSSSTTTTTKYSSLPIKATSTTNAVRLKCREMLASALESSEYNVDFNILAAAIEDCIYQEFNNTEVKYKNRVRSRVLNIRDVKNPQLKIDVLEGVIPPEKIAVMTAEEMASAELKKLRAQLTKESIDDHQMASQGGTKSDLFKCGRCGKRDTTYNQVQTRSADEPMTTFVLCNACGNRWKFC